MCRPAHLTAPVEGMITTQVIVPGTGCRSAGLLTKAWAACRGSPLFITSANRSRYVTGAPGAPAQWQAGHCATSGQPPHISLTARRQRQTHQQARRRSQRRPPHQGRAPRPALCQEAASDQLLREWSVAGFAEALLQLGPGPGLRVLGPVRADDLQVDVVDLLADGSPDDLGSFFAVRLVDGSSMSSRSASTSPVGASASSSWLREATS